MLYTVIISVHVAAALFLLRKTPLTEMIHMLCRVMSCHFPRRAIPAFIAPRTAHAVNTCIGVLTGWRNRLQTEPSRRTINS